MKLFHLFPSAQESPAESERIFRGAASPGTERNRPPDGQQQGGLPGRHDRVRDAQADHVRRRAHSLQRMEVPRRGLHGKDVVSPLTLSSQSPLPLVSPSAAFLLRVHVAYCCRLLFVENYAKTPLPLPQLLCPRSLCLSDYLFIYLPKIPLLNLQNAPNKQTSLVSSNVKFLLCL